MTLLSRKIPVEVASTQIKMSQLDLQIITFHSYSQNKPGRATFIRLQISYSMECDYDILSLRGCLRTWFFFMLA
ncbi:NADPH--cytochrome P450 reductase-like [Iris pallida]|uniref:NADPH--cytochrome P450 reductase-like n=1 Tax=Iris pallida TaxID=29817 RepID=A0AAX6DZ06_IRIPA|nr:NADPH--cytochrome P450 reductase-like [Iris pallida]